jgi:hypothetical protein
MRKLIGDYYHDNFPVHPVHVESQARTDFREARDYAISLIDIHDEKTLSKAGRPPKELDALKSSSLILAVTAWESFVEDSVQQQLERLLSTCAAASDVGIQKVFNSVADEWLDPNITKPKPPTLVQWTGDGWKNMVRSSLAKKLENFHSPDTDNTDALFKRYVGIARVSEC